MAYLIYGDLKITSGEILNCTIENLANDPDFNSAEKGRVIFNTSTNKLRYNNGSEYIDSDGGANQNLINSFGAEIINSDYTFNPARINENFGNVSGLTTESSLYDVLLQLDDAITNFELSDLLNIQNVQETDVLDNGQILYFNGANFTFAGIDLFLKEFSQISTQFLKDVKVVDNLSSGQFYVYNGNSSAFQNKTLTFLYTNYNSTTNHTISHNLGSQYCLVSVINLRDNTLIPDTMYTLTFEDANTILISLQRSTPITAFIFGLTS